MFSSKDVVDDFRSEKKELIQAKGLNFQFSYGILIYIKFNFYNL